MSPSGDRSTLHAPPLWRQLQLAARLLRGVQSGHSLTAQLQDVDGAMRPGVQALVFHALRWWGLARALRSRLAPRSPAALPDALLCTALGLLSSQDPPAYAPFTLVDQAVEAAKRDPAMRSSAAFLNACLRRFLREREPLLRQALQGDLAARWNHPPWWVERLQSDHPTAWAAILAAAQQPAPMDLRVNTARSTVDALRQRLSAAGMQSTACTGAAVRLARPRPVQEIPGFAAGDVSVQSAAAQLAAPLLLRGLRGRAPQILDACAAPGGKTAHLLELSPEARVTAIEIDPARGKRIQENLDRLGLRAEVRIADAGDVGAWWRGERFDGILLDAPCSASGIGSRHPDVRWLRRASDLTQLARQQDRLLNALWPLLVDGGRLLYCTCSVFRIEGDQRVAAFVANNSDATLLPSPGYILPAAQGTGAELGDNGAREDGFFYALLEKHSD